MILITMLLFIFAICSLNKDSTIQYQDLNLSGLVNLDS